MRKLLTTLAILMLLAAGALPAQDERPGDESSQRTDESEEAYRRRMELEGARDRDTYADTTYQSDVEQEKIDKLPPESQKNIRDQITDIIIENDQWEPSDVLEDYPYEPTEEAKRDPALMDQEQEAWAEQVDKYHQREAEAFGSTRPQLPGADGQAGSPGGPGMAQQQGGQGGSGQNGQQDDGEGGSAGGGYNPNASGQSGEDDVSTAGVAESALDFLMGQRGAGGATGGSPSPGQAPSPQQGQPGSQPNGTAPQGQGSNESADEAVARGEQAGQPADPSAMPSEQPGDTAPDGSLPIEQLRQMQGVGQEVAAAGAPDQGNPDQAAPGSQSSQAQQSPEASQSRQQMAQDQSEQQETQTQQEQSPELQMDTPGIIAIRDLDKLEGVEESDDESRR